jgi:crotonobetainyl-CoA:carnitine CoA-transferase CaiB-like acyl-CoA transferase
VHLVSAERGRVAPRSLHDLTVVDLSALWAGPLCANVLGLAGARVIKVDSTSRPDGARRGPNHFFDLLHAGHRSVALDFTTDLGRQWLRRLLASADVVIESSRPRALHALGASFEHMHADGWGGVWLSITAHGRDDANAMRVGFGDDAAVAGGLLARHDGGPVFCADAVADPLTGLLGAATVLTALQNGTSGLHAISLARTAAHVAAGIHRHAAIDTAVPVNIARPRARAAAGRAAALGADTDDVLAGLTRG